MSVFFHIFPYQKDGRYDQIYPWRNSFLTQFQLSFYVIRNISELTQPPKIINFYDTELESFICEIEVSGEDSSSEKHIYEGPPISIDVSFEDAIDCKQGLVFADVIAKRLLSNDSIKFAVSVKSK